jgi:hypothetical protein
MVQPVHIKCLHLYHSYSVTKYLFVLVVGIDFYFVASFSLLYNLWIESLKSTAIQARLLPITLSSLLRSRHSQIPGPHYYATP